MVLPRPLAVAIAVAGVVAAVGALRAPARPVPPTGAIADDRGVDRITGVVTSLPTTTALGTGAELTPEDPDASPIWVWSSERLLPGDRIAVTGRLRTPRGMADPGAPPVSSSAYELSAIAVERLGTISTLRAHTLRWAAETQRAWATAIADATGPDPDDAGAAALRGIVTGDRGTVPPALDQRWRACGIFHALSVSGLHLAVVAGLAFALLRRLAAGSPWGGRIRPARWAAPPALVLAIGYTLVTGAQLATLRSLVVIAIVLAAQMLDRPMRLVDALGLAAIALVLWHPDDLHDPSFQLSFAAALALALHPKRPPALAHAHRIVRWIRDGIATSAWVALVTAPITAFHFHQLQPGGVVGNLVLTPVLELVALPVGLAGLALGAVWPAAGALLLRSAAWTVGRVDDLAGVLAHVTPVGAIAVASAITMTALVALALWLLARAQRTWLDELGWIALCAGWLGARSPPPPGALRVTFLDVGQGDAAIVELPDGAVWLVDAGGLASRHELAAAAAPGRAITRALEAYGHTAIDLAIISHPHPDHYLGLAALALPVRELWTADADAVDADQLRDDSRPRRAATLPSFGDLATALVTAGALLHHPALGLARAQAGVELWVWAPRLRTTVDAPEREAIDPVRSVNDNSLVVELRFAGRSIVFAGDVEAEGEEALVAAGLGHVDVVKVAHHGSPTSSSPAFVTATYPTLAVISCGVANTFGFPAASVVARWRNAGTEVARTDQSGAVVVTVDPAGELAVDRFLGPPP